VKLGRVRSPHDARDLRLARYITARPAGSPPARDWSHAPNGLAIKFAMLGNDRYGCCTCAALGHLEEAASVWTGVPSLITEPIVLEAYDAISEWSRSNPLANDNGANNRDALKWFRSQGYIESFVSIDPQNMGHIEFAVNAGGGAYCGFDLPLSAQKQTVWDVAPAGQFDDSYKRRSWGGHAATVIAYNARGVWIVTWGRLQFMTWEFFVTYCDEAHMAIANAWTTPGKLTASGFDLERLAADVAKVAA
jgi:hypothetical protein